MIWRTLTQPWQRSPTSTRDSSLLQACAHYTYPLPFSECFDSMETINNALKGKSSAMVSFVSVWCRCFGEDSCTYIPDIKAAVMVLVPSEPQIIITGTAHFTIPAAELQTYPGVALFEEIHIISTVTRSNGIFSLGNMALTHRAQYFVIFKPQQCL